LALPAADLGEVLREASPDWNITPDSMLPVIRRGRNSWERELTFLKWRLVPFLVYDLKADI
jgi:putative SOS response-associated peptidase YedK